MTPTAYYKNFGMNFASCPYCTVYAERGIENLAVLALIARASVGRDPFEVRGSGEQSRNRTRVSAVVNGTIFAAEQISDGTAVNLGTMERTHLMDAAQDVHRFTGHTARLQKRHEMPTCMLNHVAYSSLGEEHLVCESPVTSRTARTERMTGISRTTRKRLSKRALVTG